MVTKAELAFARSLADKKIRQEHGLFIVEGPKMVSEAIYSGWEIERIYAAKEFDALKGAEIISQKELERISALRTPQGVLALVRVPQKSLISSTDQKLILALDGVQDPGNLGTIIRTADWFGIRRIVCSENSADCFNPKSVQATMGSIFRVAVNYCDLTGWLEKNRGEFEVCGTSMEGENIYEVDFDLNSKLVIVFGSEGRGISPEVEKLLARKFSVPRHNRNEGPESLNVSVTAGIVCSELMRRR